MWVDHDVLSKRETLKTTKTAKTTRVCVPGIRQSGRAGAWQNPAG